MSTTISNAGSSTLDLRGGSCGCPLAWQVEAAVASWRKERGIDANVEVVPVVLLYRQAELDLVVVTAHG
jgi:hypothetical protein